MTPQQKQPDLFTKPEPDETHAVYVTVYKGKEYRVPVPIHLQDSSHTIQGYCRVYLRAAGVIRGGLIDD